MGKGEIARNEQFLLFLPCIFYHFGELSAMRIKFKKKCRLPTPSLRTSSKFVLCLGVKQSLTGTVSRFFGCCVSKEFDLVPDYFEYPVLITSLGCHGGEFFIENKERFCYICFDVVLYSFQKEFGKVPSTAYTLLCY